jgi:predicted proteasome-type protease
VVKNKKRLEINWVLGGSLNVKPPPIFNIYMCIS